MLGIDAKCYHNTGTFATPVWTEITFLGDFKIDYKWSRATFENRGQRLNRGKKTLSELSVTAKVKSHLTNAPYLALWAAAISPTAVIDLLILNAASTVNGARGFRGDFDVTNFGDDQGPGTMLANDLTFEVADSDNQFSSVVVVTGAPVYTAMT